ncbi:uncharacterized protein J4E88_004160 [Alternaria novae-zelandiae]|uniref:uncharacterized protein n=1 Tax=Alternaria novae-zelandiae TaxID=430562 RepID=UPI0020C441A7|nr:uncharacterized protein J4E88_004160 [Alternaria novae-zelandiae]KAI4684719.1 hypothetical protein J4E88_004160 [Alternaria novae-zelandiae]
MVRRSVRLAKPADQPQVKVFHDLDTAAVSAKSQKLEEAARARKKRRLEYGESTSSADTMIRDAMAGSDDLRDGHKPALYRGSQLNAQLSADDPRSAIVERNSLQSPLLSLPAEVRCVIFEYALGHQHVHILTDDYDTNISVDLPGPARFGVDPPHRREAISLIQARQFHNCVFPIDWQAYYRTQPYKSRPYLVSPTMRHQPQQQRFEHERVITATNGRMALFQAVCRQIYHETRFIPYELNEFSFQDEMTMKDWFGNRAAAQKRVINTVWFDQEWQRSDALFPWTYQGALIHIGKIHGVKKVYVSVAAVEHLWSTQNRGNFSKARFAENVRSLFSRRDELQVEFVK